MDNSYIRTKVQTLLFSQKTISSLCQIITENSNFKTRIHSVQTLNKFRDYHDFGASNLQVWNTFLIGLQNVTETTDFTDVHYISTLEYQLVNLFVKLVTLVDLESTTNPEISIQFSEFLYDKSREIESSINNYLRKQFKISAFSSVYSQEIDTKEIFAENMLLKEIIGNLQKAFKVIIRLIDEKEDMKIPFGPYQSFKAIVETDIDDFANLDIFTMEKAAFDGEQF
mmetsp:Transcript_10050/g.8845  ORF Transcript_10050/g.8845 Transcript_10050/m.8845 type:complete len:226 (+) Transcript_10050:380-1057(+)